jgi:hypothetical protein
MSETLELSAVLKKTPVKLTGVEGSEDFTLKELTAQQREKYNAQFDVKIEMQDGVAKASPGKAFKLMSDSEFLSMCLYNSEGKPVSMEFVNDLPDTTVQALKKKALELSGLDKASLEKAKKDLEESDSGGSE